MLGGESRVGGVLGGELPGDSMQHTMFPDAGAAGAPGGSGKGGNQTSPADLLNKSLEKTFGRAGSSVAPMTRAQVCACLCMCV